MARILFIFFIVSQMAFSQNNTNKLIDSLTIVSTNEEKASICMKLAWKFKDSDWQRALHYIQYSESLMDKVFSEAIIAENNDKIAAIYNDKDAFDVALTYYLKAYEYYQQSDQIKEKYKVENSLAIIYARLNNDEKALYYFKKQLKHHTEKKDTLFIAKTFNNIGNLYISNNVLDSALYYFNKSLLLTRSTKDDELKIILFNNLGICYTRKKDYKTAKSYFDKSINLAENIPNLKTKSWIYNSISNLYLAQKQADSALIYAQKATNLLEEAEYSFENKNALITIYKSYLLKEEYKNAALYFERYDKIRDSLNIEGKAMNVEKLRLEQQYKENEELRVLKENKESFKYYIIGFSLVIAFLILFILLIKYRNRNTKSRLEKDLLESKKKELDANLELKNKELLTVSMMGIQRNEVEEQILNELKQLKIQAPKRETQQTIDLIIKQLGSNNTDVWEEFELHYGQVYESFYNILNEKHPELTYRDKRLCALLKLNLTTKEIARITGQSTKSLENARTRLRKKLDLTNKNIDLIMYLVNLN